MITAHDIEKLARLSALEILPHEIQGLINHLNSVLQYASRVENIIELQQELCSHSSDNVLRADQEQPTDNQALIKQFPCNAQGFIVVPRIIEG